MGGAEETERIKVRKADAYNRLQFTSGEMEIDAYTKFHFAGRQKKYSGFQWDHQCFTGVDYAANLDEHAIFNIINNYGDNWEPLVNNEKGNFDFLMLNDIETRNPAVREELKKWINWYYEIVPFDGVRLDAVKHINPSFFIEWLDFIRTELKPDLFAVGEYWLSHDLSVLLKYIEATGERMSLFDAPLHQNFSKASNEKEKYDLRTIFNDTLVNAKPGLAVTLVDNHDTQPLQSLEEYTEQWFKPHAYALILLRDKGYPCIFYADIYGTCYSDKNKKGEHCEIEIPRLECLPLLLKSRTDHAYGPCHDYFDDPNCIGWIREGIEEKPGSGCAVVLNNHPGQPAEKRMHAGGKFARKKFFDLLGNHHAEVEIDDTGWGTFFTSPAGVSVWIPQL